jgi:hypothetical protein
MSQPAHDLPELSAYALGELDAAEAARVHQLIQDSPVAASELEQIEAVTDALRHGAPVPQARLTPAQRHLILRPASLPRRLGPLQPRPLPARRPARLVPWLAGLARVAAVLTVAGAAYYAGRHLSLPVDAAGLAGAPPTQLPGAEGPPPVTVVPAPSDPEPRPEIAVVLPAPAAPEPVAPAPVVESPALAAVPAEMPAPVAPAPAVAVVGSERPDAVSRPVAAPSAQTRLAADFAFINASRTPQDQFSLRPVDIRPAPPKPVPGTAFASPAPRHAPASAKESVKPRTPELYIHSWKAEVASCPWNAAHRLLRVVIQLPADQPAATRPFSYPLQVSFDPTNVREYRQLGERHQPAAELRRAGSHSVWYEFEPNGRLDGSKTIATITLPQVRFTTQTVGPFDGSKLLVQDRGLDWRQARTDFVFDTAVVGFGLLLRGAAAGPDLNHELVLSLAEQSLESDSSGERRRFVRQVREAQAAAGL